MGWRTSRAVLASACPHDTRRGRALAVAPPSVSNTSSALPLAAGTISRAQHRGGLGEGCDGLLQLRIQNRDESVVTRRSPPRLGHQRHEELLKHGIRLCAGGDDDPLLGGESAEIGEACSSEFGLEGQRIERLIACRVGRYVTRKPLERQGLLADA